MFGTKMLSVATGMIYTILITRNTKPEQYGIWANVFDVAAYFMLLASALPFWSGRFVARGKEGAIKTGFVANLILALISIVIYFPLVPVITSALNVSGYLILYLLASIQIIELYLINALESGLRIEKPQAIGYGLLMQEICKICLAYVLIVMFQEALLGAMIGYLMAVSIQIIYYIKLLVGSFGQKIQWKYVIEWLKGSIANIYQLVGTNIGAVILIFLFIFGGAPARGNYTAASTIASIISYAMFLSFALYPKLLAENSLEDVTTSLKMVLMFAIPMTAGALAIPDSLLIILQESYKEATPILSLLAVDTFILTISQFFAWVLFGVEKLDEEAKIPLKQLTKSNMFKIFTIPYVHAAITLPIAFFVLTNSVSITPVQAAIYVVIINMATHFAMFPVLCAILRKVVRIDIPWNNIAKYVFASAIMATILFILPHPTRLSTTLSIVVMGTVLYFILLIAIDKEARALFNLIWKEIKLKVKGEV